MAVNSKIDIAVDSAAFTEFKATFDKYSKALSELPSVWNDVEKHASVTKTNFEAAAVSMGVLGGSLASVTARGKEFYQVTTSTARHWKDLALSTKDVARNVLATRQRKYPARESEGAGEAISGVCAGVNLKSRRWQRCWALSVGIHRSIEAMTAVS
jgi:hypothetical protein